LIIGVEAVNKHTRKRDRQQKLLVHAQHQLIQPQHPAVACLLAAHLRLCQVTLVAAQLALHLDEALAIGCCPLPCSCQVSSHLRSNLLGLSLQDNNS
jgi:hypothetical protein